MHKSYLLTPLAALAIQDVTAAPSSPAFEHDVTAMLEDIQNTVAGLAAMPPQDHHHEQQRSAAGQEGRRPVAIEPFFSADDATAIRIAAQTQPSHHHDDHHEVLWDGTTITTTAKEAASTTTLLDRISTAVGNGLFGSAASIDDMVQQNRDDREDYELRRRAMGTPSGGSGGGHEAHKRHLRIHGKRGRGRVLSYGHKHGHVAL